MKFKKLYPGQDSNLYQILRKSIVLSNCTTGAQNKRLTAIVPSAKRHRSFADSTLSKCCKLPTSLVNVNTFTGADIKK